MAKRRAAMEGRGAAAWKPQNRARKVSAALQAYAAMTTSGHWRREGRQPARQVGQETAPRNYTRRAASRPQTPGGPAMPTVATLHTV
jgi:hypothetical protein